MRAPHPRLQVRLALLLQALAPHAMSAADFRRLLQLMLPRFAAEASTAEGSVMDVWKAPLARLTACVGGEGGQGAGEMPVVTHTSLLAQKLLCRYETLPPFLGLDFCGVEWPHLENMALAKQVPLLCDTHSCTKKGRRTRQCHAGWRPTPAQRLSSTPASTPALCIASRSATVPCLLQILHPRDVVHLESKSSYQAGPFRSNTVPNDIIRRTPRCAGRRPTPGRRRSFPSRPPSTLQSWAFAS
jgi:hypothetical protein